MTSTSASMPNGTEKTHAKPSSAHKSSHRSPASNVGMHAHDRLTFLMAHFIVRVGPSRRSHSWSNDTFVPRTDAPVQGHDAVVTLKTGEQFGGIFSGSSLHPTSKQHLYILKMVKRLRSPTAHQVNGSSQSQDQYIGEGEDHTMAFDKDDTVDLAVTDVNTAPQLTNGMRRHRPRCRPPPEECALADMSPGSTPSSFRTDAEISGQDPATHQQRELQRWDAGPMAGADLSLESSGGDTSWDQFAANESMYGVQSTYDESYYTTTIDRNDPRYKTREANAIRLAREIERSSTSNSHVAEERRRDADQSNGLDEEDKYSGVRRESAGLPKRAAGAYVPPSQRPITATPTVPGAPFDPAIIASSIAKPADAKPAEAASAVVQNAHPPGPSATAVGSPNPANVASPPAAAPANKGTPEDHVRNTWAEFRRFATEEKLKARQVSDKRTAQRREAQSSKIEDLRKFAADFKLKSTVPDDLVPILAKDREKQVQIQQKAAHAAKEAQRVRDQPKSTTSTVPPSSGEATPTSADGKGITSPPHRSRAPQAGPRASVAVQGSSRPGVGKSGGMVRERHVPESTRHRDARAVRGAHGQQGSYGRQPIQPLPDNLRIAPSAIRPAPITAEGPLSPTSATRLNVNAKAFEFRPGESVRPVVSPRMTLLTRGSGASAFTPTTSSPSPHSGRNAEWTPNFHSFFSKSKVMTEIRIFDAIFSLRDRLAISSEWSEEQKKLFIPNGGVPPPYRTPPTWLHADENTNLSYKKNLPERPRMPPVPQGLPHQHAAAHMPQSHARPHPQHMPPGVFAHHGYAPNGAASVQSSPHFPHAALQQVPGGMPPGQFGGPFMPHPGPQGGFGLSPSMAFRQPQMSPGGPGGPMMHPFAQHGPMPPMPQGPYQQNRGPPPGGPPYPGNAPMQGMPQPPGGYGPNHGPPAYSPMHHAAQPHGMPPHGPAVHQHPQYYHHAPRAPPMQHSASHQGYHAGGPYPMPPNMGGPPMAMGMGPRQYSHGAGGGHPQQWTPRQMPAAPHPGPGSHQNSPGISMGPGGEEGR